MPTSITPSAPAKTPSPLPAAAAPTADPTASQFDKDTFLKLLVAQLRFQNPLSPTDGTEYIAQTAQFTMVETLQEIASSTADAALASASQTATSMVGRYVTFMVDGKRQSGLVTAARLDRSGPTVVVAGKEIPIAAVTEVGDGPTTSASSGAGAVPTTAPVASSAAPAAPGAATPPAATSAPPPAGLPTVAGGTTFVTLGSLSSAR
jgi:flagellar basal-body rod modification protein FlgD